MGVATITGTTPGACACCGVGSVSLFCRTRGGIAALVGCAEFVPSNPVRAYRLATASGSATTKGYAGPVCAGVETNTVTCVYTGFTQYDPSTGVPTNGGSLVCNGIPSGTGCPCSFNDACNINFTFSATVATEGLTNACCPDGSTGNSLKSTATTFKATLTDEDLESDAIARLLAGTGGIWSSWNPIGDGTGGTCLADSCCEAEYEQRTASFSFGYQESQFKADMTLLDPSTNYVLSMKLYRRLYGSLGPWSLVLTSNYGFTSDALGTAEVTDDVPNLEGYETYMAEPLVYKP